MSNEELMAYVLDYKPQALNYSEQAVEVTEAMGYRYEIASSTTFDYIETLANKSLDILLVASGLTQAEFKQIRQKVK